MVQQELASCSRGSNDRDEEAWQGGTIFDLKGQCQELDKKNDGGPQCADTSMASKCQGPQWGHQHSFKRVRPFAQKK